MSCPMPGCRGPSGGEAVVLGGRGSERVQLSGQWRPDPGSRSVVSKDWAKWKSRGPSPGPGKKGWGRIKRVPWG